jgi:hypothetical protein
LPTGINDGARFMLERFRSSEAKILGFSHRAAAFVALPRRPLHYAAGKNNKQTTSSSNVYLTPDPRSTVPQVAAPK